MTEEPKRIGRRAVVRGAAWSAPVVMAVSAAPAFAASTPTGPTTFTQTVNGNGSTPVSQTIVVPPGQRYVKYTVTGGNGGGGNVSQGGIPGGTGDQLSGYLDLGPNPTGGTLTVIPGGGGVFGGVNATVLGGAGYGNGGNSTGGNGIGAGSGGGGSAILFNGQPVVVAGGGGAAGSSSWIDTQGTSGANNPGVGGNGGLTATEGQDGSTRVRTATTTADAGNGATGGTGGAAGDSSGAFFTVVGNAGQDHGAGANGGGNGAQGKQTTDTTAPFVTPRTGSGGGGGGYAGGGSGAGGVVKYFTGSTIFAAASIGAAGGGGSSFIGSVTGATPTNTSDTQNPGASGTTASNGFVTVSY